MEHNFASFTGRSNEEIMKDNMRKYMGEIKPSWEKPAWYYKYPHKMRLQAFFFFGFVAGIVITIVCSLLIIWLGL